MKAVILAAGLGTRLRSKVPKPLVKVAGREIIYRTMRTLSKHVDEFIIVVNAENKNKIEKFLENLSEKFRYKIVLNPYPPEKGNGYSLYVTRDFVSDKFILVMGDHVFDDNFVDEAIKGCGLVVDKLGLFINKDEATKVRVKNGKIEEIGKNLKNFDFFDTGFFILNKSIFKVADELIRKNNKVEISDIAKKAKLKVYEVSGHFWMDIDTKDDLKIARKHIVRKSIKKYGDGFIARYINRKISTRISELLVDYVSPNKMTVISTLVGILSSFLIYFNVKLASILYQFSSILDGCDGEIARASLNESKIGGYIDSVLDRYVDFLFLSFLALTIPLDLQTLIAVFFAIFGSFMISYSTERYKAAFFDDIYKKVKIMRYLPGKRDERIFVIMVFCLLGFIRELIFILAIWTNVRVILTVSIAKMKS